MAYPGSPEPLAFGETGLHGAVLLEVTGSTVQAHPISTQTYQSVREQVDVSQLTNRDAVLTKIQEALEDKAGERVLAQVTLVGTRHPDVIWDMALFNENLPKNFLHIFLEDETLPAFPLEDLKEEKTVRGEFVRKLLDDIEKASDDQKEVFKDALTYGLFAFEKKEIFADN